MTNVQFVQCGTALKTANASFYAGNILMSRVGAAFYGQNFQGQVEQLTFDQGNHVTEDPNGAENGVSYLNLVNSLLTSVTDYGVVQVNTTDVAKLPNGSGIYQVAGAGSYYLDSGGAYHNAGTPAINSGLLAQLSQKTTYPPTVYAGTTFSTATSFSPTVPRDNSGVPDYGYHYDPLDVAFGGVTANANLTFTPGTAAGWFELPGAGGAGYGIGLPNGICLTFTGTVTAPCAFARYSTVQCSATIRKRFQRQLPTFVSILGMMSIFLSQPSRH